MRYWPLDAIYETSKHDLDDQGAFGTAKGATYTAVMMTTLISAVMDHMRVPVGRWQLTQRQSGKKHPGYYTDKFVIENRGTDNWAVCVLRLTMSGGDNVDVIVSSKVQGPNDKVWSLNYRDASTTKFGRRADVNLSDKASVDDFLSRSAEMISDYVVMSLPENVQERSRAMSDHLQ